MVRLRIYIDINEDGDVVIPIQDDAENLAEWTNGDSSMVYFEPIIISPTVELIRDKEKGGWVFRSR